MDSEELRIAMLVYLQNDEARRVAILSGSKIAAHVERIIHDEAGHQAKRFNDDALAFIAANKPWRDQPDEHTGEGR